MRSWAVGTLWGNCPDPAPGSCFREMWWLFMETKVFLLQRGSVRAEDQLGSSCCTSGRAYVGTGLSCSRGHQILWEGLVVFIRFRILSPVQASLECLATPSLPYPPSCHQPSPIPATAVLLRPEVCAQWGSRLSCKPTPFPDRQEEETGHHLVPGPPGARPSGPHPP